VPTIDVVNADDNVVPGGRIACCAIVKNDDPDVTTDNVHNNGGTEFNIHALIPDDRD
jgi:hypothetical protein